MIGWFFVQPATDEVISEIFQSLNELGFTFNGADHYRDEINNRGFASFRKDEFNLIITNDETFKNEHIKATAFCKLHNVMEKPKRIALFRAFLYNETWPEGFVDPRPAEVDIEADLLTLLGPRWRDDNAEQEAARLLALTQRATSEYVSGDEFFPPQQRYGVEDAAITLDEMRQAVAQSLPPHGPFSSSGNFTLPIDEINSYRSIAPQPTRHRSEYVRHQPTTMRGFIERNSGGHRMKITIIDPGQYNHAVQGWQNSRDNEAVNYTIATIDAPVNELPSMLLKFEDFTIIEREIFFSARNHVAWARTSRVDDPLQFTVPTNFNVPAMDDHRAFMLRAKTAGLGQDEWRMALPLLAHTSWTARISFRDLVKLHKYFMYLAGRVTEYLRPRFAKVARQLHDVMVELIGTQFASSKFIVNEAVEKMKPIRFLSEKDDTSITPTMYDNDPFLSITAVVPVALRAQLVRHRDIVFIDDFYRLLNDPKGWMLTLGTKIMVQATATQETWRRVLSERACWIAQADLWAPITLQFNEGILPCADGPCPYAMDAMKRVEGKDPNAPCPKFCNMNNIDKEPFKAHMQLQASKRGVERLEFWHREIEA
jgi:hypothetical protein